MVRVVLVSLVGVNCNVAPACMQILERSDDIAITGCRFVDSGGGKQTTGIEIGPPISDL